uniref:Uncharacterized protein n=1 Tax=Avena sativa TaxID=4498 RepID=A0ACD5YF55_AVESA
MEFSRRGPATGSAADSHRCPDPPPHGDTMLVMRDALLWQLHKDRLRQEIIVAELGKIERAMALRATSAHHTTPIPWDGMLQHSGPFFGWEHYGDVDEENDVKLRNNDRQSAETRFWKPVVEDHASKCWNPCKCRGNVGQQNSAIDEPKLQDSVEVVPPSKMSPAVKWELTGITIPVKKPKPKPPMTWSCTVCQVQVNIEKVVQKHCAGGMHQSNIATLESRIKSISGRKAKKGAEPSGTDQRKTSSIRWSCSTCRAKDSNINTTKNNGPDEAKSHKCNVPQHAEKKYLVGCSTCQVICGRESDLQVHIKGKGHLNKIQALLEESKNVAALCKEGSNDDMAKNISPHEAKWHERNVPHHAEKPPLVSCHFCQVVCGREPDLEIHLKGKRHLNKILVLFEESKNMTMHSDSHKTGLNLDSGENQLRIRLREPTQRRKTPTESQSEHHYTNRKHEQKIIVILGEGDIAKVSSVHIEVPCKEGSNNDMLKNIVSREAKSDQRNMPEHAEKPPSILCESDLDVHLMSKRIQDIVKECRNMAMDSESQNAKLNPNSVPQHVEETNCQLNCESHHELRDERLQQMNDRALHEKINQDRNNPPEIAKDQIPSSEWDCAMCEAKCSSNAQLEHHCTGRKHQQKINVTLSECDNAKLSSLGVEVPFKGGSNNDMVKNIASQEAKLHDSNVPKCAEKPTLVEETNCQLNCESHHELRDERLQQMNDRALQEKINQDRNNPPEIAKDQIPSSEWDCAILGVEVPFKGGSNNDMVKNIASQEAKLHDSNVPKCAEKPTLVGCSICQVVCGRELDLVIHLNGKRHIKKIRSLLEESQNNAMDSESQKANLNPDSVPQLAEMTNYELDLDSHLREERLHLMDDQTLHKGINQDKNNPPEPAKDQIPSLEWDCAICQAKCNSRTQFENHCISRKHQRKTQVILGEGDIAKVSSVHIEVPCKEGSNNDMLKNIVSREAKSDQRNMPEHAEKPPSIPCESDLDVHLMSKRIQDIVKECRNMEMDSESRMQS